MQQSRSAAVRVALIGGSAGSLDPLSSLLGLMSVDAKIAIVVAQHLNPSKESSLIKLLKQRIAMPVQPLLDGQLLVPGIVYVVTPGDEIVFEEGKVSAKPTGGDIGAQHVIDRVAVSLANDATIEPVLVILSGNGHDGTVGAARFYEKGLPVIVQTPGEAQFPSMPASVIQKKRVNEVLSAIAISARLTDFSERGLVAIDTAAVAPSEEHDFDLTRVVDLLRMTVARDFSGYRSGTLHRRLTRRMALHGCSTTDEYLERYSNDKQELSHLADDFLIRVTRFFRDPDAFDALREDALPGLFDGVAPGGELRTWVVGCSTGEEAYSVAISLSEYKEKHRPDCSLKIFATDADRAAVDFARTGVYEESALEPLSLSLRDKYFTHREKSYQVSRELRELVVFAAHNVISEPPFSNLDLIVCRNLLIYLGAKIKLALLRLFHFTLREEGVLFLGSSEFLGRVDRHFSTISKPWRIFRRSVGAPRRAPHFPLFSSPYELKLTAPDATEVAPSLFGSQSIMRGMIETHGAAQLLVDEADRVVYSLGEMEPYLQLPKGEPTEDLLQLAIPALRAPLQSLLNAAKQEGYAMEGGIWCSQGGNSGFMVSLAAAAVNAAGFEGYLAVSFSRGPLNEHRSNTIRSQPSTLATQMLQKEIDATREDIQQTIKRSRTSDGVLRRANEEIMAMNEEFQSANEELEASKEEMQSLNDELALSNGRLHEKMHEIQTLNSDLENVFRSSDGATLILDGNLRIKRFTPNIVTLMRLRDADIARDVGDITRLFDDIAFIDDIRESIGAERAVEAEVRAENGRVYIRRVLPYLDKSSQVAGAVVNFIDVSELHASIARDRESTRILRWQAKLLDMAAPVLGRSEKGTITFWNGSAALLWGYSSNEALGKNAHELLQTRFSGGLKEAEASLAATGRWRGVVTQSTKAGRVIQLSTSWTATQLNKGAKSSVSEVYQDLTATMELKSALREEQELFHLLFDWTANAEYWSGADGRLTYVTPAIEDISGYTPQEFIDDTELLGNIVDETARGDWLRHVSPNESPPPNHWKSINLPIRRKDGEVLWVEHRFRIIYSSDSEILGYRGTIRDIDEVHRLEGEANRLAYTDPLTDLLNRRALAQKLDDVCAAGERSSQQNALVMLDLDHFKIVNDTDGHPVGDLLLLGVADRIQARLRAVDTVARVGGDEFMLILSDLGTDQEQASLAAHRICNGIREDLQRPFHLEGASVDHRVSASVGLVLFSGRSTPVNKLIQQADMALYSAKDQGRNKTVLFDPKMQSVVEERLGTDHALATALNSDGLRLVYQAQVSSDGRLVGTEALLRLVSPKGELLSPETFIKTLEGQPMVSQLGRWVLEAAMRQLVTWSEPTEQLVPSLSVNVSPGYLLSDAFFDDVTRLLGETGADPARLIFEVTEHALLTDIPHSEAILTDIAALGIRISLDDFGTGYSSLSHLKSLPISELKIDRSFVTGLPNDNSSAALIEATIAIGKALQLAVVAEGVETEEQRAKLSDIGCARFQGYLFSIPALAKDFEIQFDS